MPDREKIAAGVREHGLRYHSPAKCYAKGMFGRDCPRCTGDAEKERKRSPRPPLTLALEEILQWAEDHRYVLERCMPPGGADPLPEGAAGTIIVKKTGEAVLRLRRRTIAREKTMGIQIVATCTSGGDPAAVLKLYGELVRLGLLR